MNTEAPTKRPHQWVTREEYAEGIGSFSTERCPNCGARKAILFKNSATVTLNVGLGRSYPVNVSLTDCDMAVRQLAAYKAHFNQPAMLIADLFWRIGGGIEGVGMYVGRLFMRVGRWFQRRAKRLGDE